MRNVIYEEGTLALDDGLTFGRGVFETMLVYNGNIILLDYHLERLNNSIKKLQIGSVISKEEIIALVSKVDLSYNKVLKLVVTIKNILVTTRDINYKYKDYQKGFALKISDVKRNSTSILTYIKSTNYIENIIENNKAKTSGYNEVIFLNENNYIAEGSTSNIFMINDGIIYTPRVETGILPGVIRRWVLENFQVVEKDITIKELNRAQEIFVTNSVMGIMRVYKLEEKEYNQNSITNDIINKYKVFLNDFGGSK